MRGEIELLRELVAIPSVSGSETELATFLETVARRWGLDVVRDSDGVRVELRGFGVGPSLALVSHLDVVPPGPGWTRDPFVPSIEDNRLYGRGSSDAKASVAAMLYAEGIGTRLAIGWTMGTIVSVLGMYFSVAFDLPTGATIVCTFGAVLIAMAAVKPLVVRKASTSL